MSGVPYFSLVGSLIYAIMCTHTDICYATSLINRYPSNFGRKYWKAAQKILRYLKDTNSCCLCYQENDLCLN